MKYLFKLLCLFSVMLIGNVGLAQQGSYPADAPRFDPIQVVSWDGSAWCYNAQTDAVRARPQAMLANCRSASKWSYDVLGRISTNYLGLNYCLTAPASVINADLNSGTWDWVKLQRCDIANPYQQWRIKDWPSGTKHFVSNKKGYRIKDWQYGLYLSTDDAGNYNHNLHPKMSDWMNTFARPADLKLGLSMSWIGVNSSGQRISHYPNYNATNTVNFRDYFQSVDILYDVENRTIEFQNKNIPDSNLSFCWQASNSGLYLTKTQCNSTSFPDNNKAKWNIVHLGEEGSNAVVALVNEDGQMLRVANNGGNWGRVYAIDASGSETDVANSPTSLFYVNKSAIEWMQFENRNAQKRLPYCPARPDGSSLIQPRALPPNFVFTSEWLARLRALSISAPTPSSWAGLCGTCVVETAEMLRELLDSRHTPGQTPPADGHYFPLDSTDPAADFNVQMFFASQRVSDVARAGMAVLRGPNLGRLQISDIDYQTIEVLLPDYAVSRTPLIRGLSNLDAGVRTEVNSAPPGSVWFVTMRVNTGGSSIDSIGHSFGLVHDRQQGGYRVLTTNATLPRMFENYLDVAHPNIGFSLTRYISQFYPAFSGADVEIMLTRVNDRRPVVTTPSVSTMTFGNCTGDGEGERGGATASTRTINVCTSRTGGRARCMVQ